MTPTFQTFLIICPLVFFAGFVDSVAGGGGLISVPAYLLAGFPIHAAYGTNKLSSSCGTLVSTARYFTGGYVRLPTALAAAVAALAGSWLGARLVTVLDERVLRVCLLVILPAVAVFLLLNRKFGAQERDRELPPVKLYPLALAIGFCLGGYDGFFGPGTGTFLVLAFTSLMGLSLTSATGSAKVVNLASNLAALAVYLLDGRVVFSVGIPAAVCGIAGNWLGASLAVRGGARFIRPVLVFVLGLLFASLVWDFLK